MPHLLRIQPLRNTSWWNRATVVSYSKSVDDGVGLMATWSLLILVTARSVRILLECFLVQIKFWWQLVFIHWHVTFCDNVAANCYALETSHLPIFHPRVKDELLKYLNCIESWKLVVYCLGRKLIKDKRKWNLLWSKENWMKSCVVQNTFESFISI